MNPLETIRMRRSVRSYNGKPLSPELRAALLGFVGGLTCPFGPVPAIRLKEFDLRSSFRPGTYGMISGATDFFLLAYGAGDRSALAAGYCFERVILHACALGLGTCWLGGTFKGGDFDRGQTWPDGFSLRIVSPVGVGIAPGIKDKFVSFAVGSRKRLPAGELFFEGDFSLPLPPGNRFGEALEMLRLAPSSQNSQPWRAVVSGDTVHFYYVPKGRFPVLDCGIALCHFHTAELFHHREGTFAEIENHPTPGSNLRYLISYIAGE